MPAAVGAAAANSSLLVVGFRMHNGTVMARANLLILKARDFALGLNWIFAWVFEGHGPLKVLHEAQDRLAERPTK